ncbi:MAG: SDR family NAD(P)-dependent oxidoreductase, partial [Lentisphaeria bacterium]|nr:SDR family NAD(P)-dependent oxidoreductase [Lentisphaeria bacterium]
MASIREYSDLHGRTAVITGGAGYLGRTMAHTLAEAGANIAIVDIRQEGVDQICADLKEKWGVHTCGLVVDLEKEEEVRTIPGKVAEALGSLDILMNNAAFVGTSNLSGWGVPFDEQETPTWRRALEVNLTAVFELTQAAAPYLRKSGHGSIVNTASIYG